MDLTTMRTAVRTRIGNPSTDGFFSDAQVTDLVNEALQVVSTEDDWPWLQTSETIATVAGTQAYTPAADWVRTKELHIVNFEPLVFKSLAEINNYGDVQAQPDSYTIYDEDLLLGPIPGAAYNVVHQYIKYEPALSNDNDTPIMPSQFHYAIVTKAAQLAHLRAGYAERADREEKEYQQWYRRMVSFRRRSQRPVRPRVRPGGWL